MQNDRVIKSRNVSLDLLRILSMLMIVVLHVNSHGGVLNNVSYFNVTIARLFESFSLPAVNIFVLISGYFLVDSRFKLSKILKLVLQVWFYSWIICVILFITGWGSFAAKDVISIAFPISYKEYWFITAYLLMYIMSPVLNILINSLSRNQHKFLMISLLVITSVWHDLVPASDPLFIHNGYSYFWFVVLYLIGAYIKRYNPKIDRPLFGYLLCCLLMFVSMMVLHTIVNKHAIFEAYLPIDHFSKYCSILNVVSSVSLFCFFKDHTVDHGKIYSHIASYIFGIYLIHDNIHFRDLIWGKLFGLSVTDRFIILHAAIAVVCTFVVCLFIDYLRYILFSILFKDAFWVRLDKWFYSKMDKIGVKLN